MNNTNVIFMENLFPSNVLCRYKFEHNIKKENLWSCKVTSDTGAYLTPVFSIRLTNGQCKSIIIIIIVSWSTNEESPEGKNHVIGVETYR